MKTSRRVVLSLLVILMFIGALLAAPPAAAQVDCNQESEWKEIRTSSFAVLYPVEHTGLGELTVSRYGTELEQSYTGFAAVFGDRLTLPVTIRFYPRENEYYCLNTLAPPIGAGATHSHIGSREIALIAVNITAQPYEWDTQALNAFRHELVVLFAEQLTEGYAPPGLLDGLGGYAENPAETFEDRYQASALGDQPDQGWQALWENDHFASEDADMLQATSTVAYLIDVYGWESFVALLRNLATTEGYRQALSETYGLSVQELNRHWQEYFPAYLAGRWRANIFHSFDLTVFEELIAAGAYADALAGLEEAIPILQSFGDEAALIEAQSMTLNAQLGIEAGALTGQARQALLEGEFASALQYAEQAKGLYEQLGDTRRLTELTAYSVVAEKVVKLRGEIEEITESGGLPDPIAPRRLIQIGRALSELGDGQGIGLVNLALAAVSEIQRRIIAGLSAIGALVCLFLLARRVWALRKPAPAETKLL